MGWRVARNGGGNGQRGNRKGKGARQCGGEFVCEIKGGQVSGWFGRKPNVIVHLNIEGGF
jgi:hypothetical protein